MPSDSKHSASSVNFDALKRGALIALAAAATFLAPAMGISGASAGNGGVGGGGTGGGGGGDTGAFTFPIKGNGYEYGDGFGAGRGHEGQDVFADCGTELVALASGKIQLRDRHSAAGNYVVVDPTGSKFDFVYSHLKRRATPREGDRVRKGETIGAVGDTGNASGCHLHFEMWSKPGYYEGGRALPRVTRFLKSIE